MRAGKATEDEIKALVDFTKRSGGIEYAQQKMEEFRNRGLAFIGDDGNAEVGEALRLYMDFVLKRVS